MHSHRVAFATLVLLSSSVLPSAFAAAGDRILALDKDGGRLHIIEESAFTLRHSVDVGRGAHEVIAARDGRSAYVALYGDAHDAGHTLVEVDLDAGDVKRRIDTAPLLRPHGLARAGDNIYFTAELNRAVARFNPETGTVDRIYGIGHEATHMLEIAADGQQLFTTDLMSGSVSHLDFRAKSPLPALKHYPIGDKPEGLALHPDGTQAWVGLNGEGQLRVLDLATGKVVASLPAGSYPARVEFSRDGRYAFAIDPHESRLLVFDVAERRQLHAHRIEGVPLGIAPASTPDRIFLTLVKAGEVVDVDIVRGTVLRRVAVGQVADGIALAAGT